MTRSSVPRSRGQLGGERVPGLRAVHELLTARTRRVRRLIVSTERDRSPLLDEILDLADDAGVSVERVDAERVRDEARVEAPQGVVALADSIGPARLDDLLAHPSAFLVALDGVTDPRNLGAALRSAETAGATGAIVHIPFALVGGVPAALEQAARAGVWTIGLDAAGDTAVFDVDLADRPLALVFGAEGAGLARLTRDRCDVVARIPMHGQLESLNVSAAAAVACFEIARRRAR